MWKGMEAGVWGQEYASLGSSEREYLVSPSVGLAVSQVRAMHYTNLSVEG